MRVLLSVVILSSGCVSAPASSGRWADVTGSLERVGDTADWVGVETVSSTDDTGSCVLVRKVLARESVGECPDCEILLEAVDREVESETKGCAGDLATLPVLAEHIGFVLFGSVEGSGAGDLVVGTGQNWRTYASGVLDSGVGVLTWHHRLPMDQIDPWSFDPADDVRDLPAADGAR